MSIHMRSAEALDYHTCRVRFRGPRPVLTDPHIAFLGGTETFGRFVATPFPRILQNRLGVECANFGVMNAGVDLYLAQECILKMTQRADAVVLQVLGAQNLSNRFYRVHPRRNDRFLSASDAMQRLYPEVDFTEFHFVRHLLCHLRECGPERFETLVAELQMAWIKRMKLLLAALKAPVVLFWFADIPPPETADTLEDGAPLFVTAQMLASLQGAVSVCVEYVVSDRAVAEGTEGMVFLDEEAEAAERLAGPRAHDEAADCLEVGLRSIVGSA